jgi:hypothetical protein
MTDRRQRHARKGGSTEIRPGELMAPWIYDKKFLSSCGSCLERCHSRWERTAILGTRLKNKKSGDKGTWLSSRNPYKNRSRYRSILWLLKPDRSPVCTVCPESFQHLVLTSKSHNYQTVHRNTPYE